MSEQYHREDGPVSEHSELLIPAALHTPEAVALCDAKQRITWAELVAMSAERAATLGARGLAGKKVTLQRINAISVVIDLFALWILEAVPVLVHPRWPLARARRAAQRIAATWPPLSPGECNSPRTLASRDAMPRLALDTWLDVVFTSGSTGYPKAVVHTFANHLASARSAAERLPFGAKDVWLASLPLCHVGGLALVTRASRGGGALALVPSGVPIGEAVRRFCPTHLSLVAAQLDVLLRDSAALRVARRHARGVLLGGGPFTYQQIERARDAGLPVMQTYGCTELTSQVATSTPERPFACGRPLGDQEVHIGSNQVIKVRGAALFAGYLEGEKLCRPLDDGGFFDTGDIGQWNADGDLEIVGRKDAQLISGGENIQPEEIERVLLGCAGVRQAVVVGVPDVTYGQRPVAFVQRAEEASDAPAEEWHSRLLQELEHELPRFMVPDALLPWPASLEQGLKPSRRDLTELARRLLGHPPEGGAR